jgi:acyl-CoA thioesterase 8
MPSALTTSLSVSPHPSSPDTYTSQSLWVPCGARGVFGGQVIAQALSSSSHTIPPHQGLHSTHCYFLLPASGSQAITYAVDRLRDGKSYATRLVKGMQGQKVVFVLMASYAVGGIEGEIKGETPFGFVPTLSDGKAKGKGKGKGAVSHSLTFTVEPSGKREEEGEGDGKEAEGKGIDGVPGFMPRFQVDMPDDIVPYEECELEEARWERYIRERGEKQGEKGRKAVQEYLQVGSASI